MAVNGCSAEDEMIDHLRNSSQVEIKTAAPDRGRGEILQESRREVKLAGPETGRIHVGEILRSWATLRPTECEKCKVKPADMKSGTVEKPASVTLALRGKLLLPDIV